MAWKVMVIELETFLITYILKEQWLTVANNLFQMHGFLKFILWPLEENLVLFLKIYLLQTKNLTWKGPKTGAFPTSLIL
jgi:hypothetical protein